VSPLGQRKIGLLRQATS